MSKTILITGFIIFASYCYAANLSQPPILKDEPIAEQQYLKEIADRFNTLEVVTTTPNGNRKGKYGEMVLLNSSGTYYLEVCTSSPSGTVWKGVALSATP